MREKVFEVRKWPHYELLLKHVQKLIDEHGGKNKRLLICERTRLYGGCSLLAPVLDPHFEVVSMDLSVHEEEYNTWRVGDGRFVMRQNDFGPWEAYGGFDIALVPNVLHHVPGNDPGALFYFLRDIPLWLVFDVALEEVHQAPVNWGYFTPHGFQTWVLGRYDRTVEIETTGSPFTVAAHFVDNAAECLTGGSRNWLQSIRNALLNIKAPEIHFDENGNRFREKTETVMAWAAWCSR